MWLPIVNTKQLWLLPTPLPGWGNGEGKRDLVAFLLPPALPHAGARAIANTYTSLLLHGSARAMEELAAGLCWLHWHSSRGRKKGKVLGGVCEAGPTTASTTHQAGPGPSSADLKWGAPQCAQYCSELRREGPSFHPEGSQGRGDHHIVISRPPLLHGKVRAYVQVWCTYRPDSWLSGLL